ncbi:unnamed protein product [Polarella glacialis]|uniref:PH domain-containing protein n=1 Tax=Polarella glacialis TaxID=89957 RepID=A0A813KHT8_POLGL|nr:unnamed protein product [Polarella glacialis]
MLLSATPLLCRCICGSRNDDLFDPTKAYGDTAHSEADFEDDPSQRRPPFTGVLSYDSTSDQPLRGAPIREGPLWLLSADEEVALVTVSLYVNGLGFKHRAQEHSYSFSPFSLVRNCKFQAITSEGVDLAEFKCFKVSMFTQAQCFYFGVKSVDDADTEEERSRWVMDVSRAMRLVTQSLFPPVQMSCEPLRNVPNTWNRLMALRQACYRHLYRNSSAAHFTSCLADAHVCGSQTSTLRGSVKLFAPLTYPHAVQSSMTDYVSLDCNVHSAGGAKGLLSGIGGLLIRDACNSPV